MTSLKQLAEWVRRTTGMTPTLCGLLILGCSLLACNANKPDKETAPGPEKTESVSPKKPQTYGDPIGESPAYVLSELLANPKGAAGQTVRVSGHVRRACSAKGCWMELATDAATGSPACRVTFKDYAFFVPTDSAGAQAVVEGQVAVKRVSAPHVRHYEGEGATFPSKHEDGSADELRIVATGVELTR